jgi:acetylornithine deacetylase/succinyl-diaminopimelate desuccinylase-like protein
LDIGTSGQALVVSSNVPAWVGLTVSHISGLQAALDAKASTAHRATHASGGSDAFTSSDLLEAVVRRLRETSGPTTLTVGAVADGQFLRRSGTSIVGDTPPVLTHKDTHKSGGSDAFTSSDLLEAVVRRLQESSGPTILTLGAVSDGQFLKRSGIGIVGDTPPVLAHKSTHITGGSDAFTSSDLLEAVVKRLQESSGPTTLTVGSVSDGQFLRRSGTSLVGDTPPVLAHKSTHTIGGSDAFTSSDLLEAVVKRLQESGGPTNLTLGSVSDGQFLRRSGTSIIGATPPVLAHRDTHKSGGSDAFTSSDLLEAVVKRLQESSGPTNLTLGAVSDGQFLKRSGTNIVGDTPPVLAHKDTHTSGGSDAFASSDLLEAAVKRLQESEGPTILTLGTVSSNQLLVRSGTSLVGTPRTYQWIGRTSSMLGTSTVYLPLSGVFVPDATENNVVMVATNDIRITGLRIRLSAVPGSGASRTFTLRTTFTDTAATITISDFVISGVWTGDLSIPALTRMSISATASGSPTSSHALVAISLYDAS